MLLKASITHIQPRIYGFSGTVSLLGDWKTDAFEG